MSKRISLWVPDELAEAIDAEATRAQRTRNDYLVKYLTTGLPPTATDTLMFPADLPHTSGLPASVPAGRTTRPPRYDEIAPLPCRCGGLIYQIGVKKGKCSLCTKPLPV